MVSYSEIGDVLHVVNLLNIIVYGIAIYQYGSYGSGIFDESWLQRGFCTPHDENNIPYHTTHDYSGHAMAVISIVGIALQQWLSRQSRSRSRRSDDGVDVDVVVDLTKANTLAFWAMIGALGHAWGHYFIAFGIRENFYPPGDMRFIDDLMENSSSVLSAIGKAVPGYPCFWIPLVGTYMHNTAKNSVALIALFCWLGSMFMQVRFGFSYTQAVLFAGLSIDQLLMLPQTEKECFEYALWPLLTTVPNGILAWIESTSCTTDSFFLMKKYGHVIYDMYMAMSYIVFYIICYVRANYYYRFDTMVKEKSKQQ